MKEAGRLKRVEIREITDRIRTFGRTYQDDEDGILYFDWTCSGVEFLFKGTCLTASFRAMCSEETDGTDPITGKQKKREVWPWAAVFADGSDRPQYRFEIGETGKNQMIWFSSREETHRIKIVKLTENLKTFLGLESLYMDGELLPLPDRQKRKKIEFIGDSITCGFGNETEEKDRLFYSGEENGWFSHAAIAARKLEMDWNMICVSGICTGKRRIIPMPYAMKDLYVYTDRILEEKLGKKELQKWDFAGSPSDYVVINLGTNDATGIAADPEPEEEREKFCGDYTELLKMIRQCNGPGTQIICALGSMNYYLYPDIMDTVKRYCAGTGDKKISCFRYLPMDMADPVGACGHPHRVTHEKMAEELARYLNSMQNNKF